MVHLAHVRRGKSASGACRTKRKSIAPAEAQALLKRIEAYFEITDPAFITDVGKYELTLCYDERKLFPTL